MKTYRGLACIFVLALVGSGGCVSTKHLTWGSNQWGQLGLGGGGSQYEPVELLGVPRIRRASGGSGHTVAATSRGKLWAWGLNSAGQVGDVNPSQTEDAPVRVLQSNGSYFPATVDVQAGLQFNVAMTQDGVWAWGNNDQGQTGNGTTTPYFAFPTRVLDGVSGGPLSDVTMIAAGGYHAVALKADGTVWVWGANPLDILGTATGATQVLTALPVKDPSDPTGYLRDVIQIAAGSDFTLAVRRGGTVVSWGGNAEGQLGDGTNGATTPYRTFPSVVRDTSDSTGVLTRIRSVAAGQHHAVAVKVDGRLFVWGSGRNGELGDGALEDRAFPVPLMDPEDSSIPFRVRQAATHLGWETFAIRRDGTVWSWGQNGLGAVGDGSTTRRGAPVQLKFPSGQPIKTGWYIGVGLNHALLVLCERRTTAARC